MKRCKKKSVTQASKLESRAKLGQVRDLQEVFKKCYGFTVVPHILDSSKNPQKDLNFYLSSFVHEYDAEGTLLILYYAGHGWSTLIGNDSTGQAVDKGFHLYESVLSELSTFLC
jgi:hypothetical protein